MFRGRSLRFVTVCYLMVWAGLMIVLTSASYFACEQDQTHTENAEQQEKGSPGFGVFVRLIWTVETRCTGAFIDTNANSLIAVFTIVLAFSTIFLWRETERLAKGAEIQTELTRSALIGVERPVLLLTMESKITAPETFADGTPRYRFGIQNVGKQVAYLIGIRGDIFIEDSVHIPVLENVMPDEGAGSMCAFNFVGEPPIPPNDEMLEIWAQRQLAISEEQISDLKAGKKFCFIKVSFLYRDPVGTVRNTIVIFALIPNDDGPEVGQMGHKDTTAKKMEDGGFVAQRVLAEQTFGIVVKRAVKENEWKRQQKERGA